MKVNLLYEWEKNIFAYSSDLNPKRTIKVNRSYVLRAKDQLEDFFGQAFFEVETFSDFLKMENPIGSNWIHSLLMSTNAKAVNQIFELVAVIEHFKNQNSGLLKTLLAYKNLKSFRQFRDYYFELYTLFIFDKNKIENQKKAYEGDKELEGLVMLNGEECLIECKKLYNDKAEHLKMNTQVVSKLSGRFRKKPYPIIVAVKYDTPCLEFLNILIKEVNEIIASWDKNQSVLILPVIKNYYYNKIELYVEPYSPDRIEGVTNESKGKNYVVFGIKPQILQNVQRHGHFLQRVISEVYSTDTEIKELLISKINKKRKNRSKSKYKHRIFFFESENYPGFDRGLFSPNGFSEEIKSSVKEYLMNKNTADVFVLIERETGSTGDKLPRIRRTVIGNRGTEKICGVLENMKYDFFI